MKTKITNQYAKQRLREAFLTSKLIKEEEEKRKQEVLFFDLDWEYEKELEREELEAFYYGKNVPPKKKD
jgi:hypothetical protein